MVVWVNGWRGDGGMRDEIWMSGSIDGGGMDGER